MTLPLLFTLRIFLGNPEVNFLPFQQLALPLGQLNFEQLLLVPVFAVVQQLFILLGKSHRRP